MGRKTWNNSIETVERHIPRPTEPTIKKHLGVPVFATFSWVDPTLGYDVRRFQYYDGVPLCVRPATGVN